SFIRSINKFDSINHQIFDLMISINDEFKKVTESDFSHLHEAAANRGRPSCKPYAQAFNELIAKNKQLTSRLEEIHFNITAYMFPKQIPYWYFSGDTSQEKFIDNV